MKWAFRLELMFMNRFGFSLYTAILCWKICKFNLYLSCMCSAFSYEYQRYCNEGLKLLINFLEDGYWKRRLQLYTNIKIMQYFWWLHSKKCFWGIIIFDQQIITHKEVMLVVLFPSLVDHQSKIIFEDSYQL